MCTVTIIRDPNLDGWRMACNRDELRTRPAALPPERRRCGARTAIMPVDPVSDGTWIAVNDAGLVLTLLNVNPEVTDGWIARPKVSRGRQSRGLIIPALMRCSSVRDAMHEAQRLAPSTYPPFRLVGMDGGTAADLRSDGSSMALTWYDETGLPLLFTSSGLGDSRVDAPRRALFEEHFEAAVDADAQDAYHRHHWPECGPLSVCMTREDAMTVSYTIIELGADCSNLTHHPAAPDQVGAVSSYHLGMPAGCS